MPTSNEHNSTQLPLFPEALSDLQLLDFSTELRRDHAAETYVDNEGYLYLFPLRPHNFAASEVLQQVGLSSGEVQYGEDGRTPSWIKYSPDTDIVPLASVFNASIDNSELLSDIVTSLKLVGLMLRRTARQCGFSPRSLTLDTLAVNRTSSTVELVAPFEVGEVRDIRVLMEELRQDALNKGKKTIHIQHVMETFAAAEGL